MNVETIEGIIQRNRSYRRFDEKTTIDMDNLKGFVNLARLSASGANRQPLKYIISNDTQRNSLIYPCLAWAGYLTDWPGPAEGERPSAYIVILGDRELGVNFGIDHGIAAQSILLGAVSRGYGGCIIATVKKERLKEALHIPDRYEILLVLALGKPVEIVEINGVGADGSIKYWRDAENVHHVPKRALKDIILDV